MTSVFDFTTSATWGASISRGGFGDPLVYFMLSDICQLVGKVSVAEWHLQSIGNVSCLMHYE